MLQVVHIVIMLKLGSDSEYTLNCWILHLSTSVKSISVTSKRSERVRTVWIGHGNKFEITTTTKIGFKNISFYKKSHNGKTTLLQESILLPSLCITKNSTDPARET